MLCEKVIGTSKHESKVKVGCFTLSLFQQLENRCRPRLFHIMASRFVLGVFVGAGGSLTVLHELTERRLSNLPRPDPEVRKAAAYTQRLRRAIFEEHWQTRDDLIEGLRLLNNQAVSSLSGKGGQQDWASKIKKGLGL